MALSIVISAGFAAGAILAIVFYLKGGTWSYSRKKNGGKKRSVATAAVTKNVDHASMAKGRVQKTSLLASSIRIPPTLQTTSAFKDGPMTYDPLTCTSLTPPSTPVPLPFPSLQDMTINTSIYENQTLLTHHSINNEEELHSMSNSVSNDVTNGAPYTTSSECRGSPRAVPNSIHLQSNNDQQYQRRERAATIAAHLIEQGQGQGLVTTAKPKQNSRRYTTLF